MGDGAFDADCAAECAEGLREVQYLLGLSVIDVPFEKIQEEMRTQYKISKAAKTGEKIRCACCGTSFLKKSYQQAFCKTKCKDQYWNTVNEDRRIWAQVFGGR